MMPPSNTPPDGDFVRYVERLAAAQVKAREDEPAAAAGAPVAMAGLPLGKAGLQSVAQIPFLRHVKWAAGLWIGTQILARFVPGAGFLFIPLLAVYAAWVLFGLSRKPPGAFLGELGKLAALTRQAAEKARKPQSTFHNNKP